MSNKKELRKQLEEAYLKGFMSGALDERGYLVGDYDENYSDLLIKLEESLYGRTLNEREWPTKAPFKNALNTWEELRESPLWKATE